MGLSGHTRSAFLHGNHELWSPVLGLCAHLPVSYPDLQDVCGYWLFLKGHCLLQHQKAERSWRASGCDLNGPVPPELQLGAVGGALVGGSSPRNKWYDLGHNFSPPWASVSSSCKMKLGQKVLHFSGHKPWFILNSLLSHTCMLYKSKSC